MRRLRAALIRLGNLFRRQRRERELAEELESHLQMHIEDNLRSGMTPTEARRQALIKLGGVEQVKEECRDAWGVRIINELAQDLRYGLRQLRRNPGFTIVAIFTLALGIGANTAIFSVIDAVLIRPLPYYRADRLVMVWEKNPHAAERGLSEFAGRNVVSPANFLVWKQENSVFESMAAFLEQPANLTGGGEPERIAVEYATPSLFPLLDVHPALGRSFRPEEGRTGGNHETILSYGLWQRRFGVDRDVLGKTLEINGIPYTVVGVMPRGFQLYVQHETLASQPPQLWVPLAFPASARQPHGRYMMAVARLKAGVTLAAAQMQMSNIAKSLVKRFPDFDTGWGVTLVPIRKELTGALQPALWVLFAAVGFVLLIACANVANLMLTRAAARERDMAVRTALGAGRTRLFRQLLTESLLIAAGGGAIGILVAYWGTAALVGLSPIGLLHSTQLLLNIPVLLFTAGLSIVAGIVFGLAPSFAARDINLQDSLKECGRSGTGGRHRHRARNLLVVTEIALALVLVAGAGLLLLTLARLGQVDTGFNPKHLLTAKLLLPGSKYGTSAERISFFNNLLDRIRADHGVRSASADVFLPFTGIDAGTGFTIVGRPEPKPGKALTTKVHIVLSGYFHTLGIPLLRGRTFSEDEEVEARNVAIINESLARRYFPNQNPLGQKIIVDMKEKNAPSTIIGVVGNVHQQGLDTPPRPTVYWPYPQLPINVMTLAVRSSAMPMSIVSIVRSSIASLDPGLPLGNVGSMDQWLGDSKSRVQFATALLGLFAAIALGLATVGIYGVMTYSSAERTHEIGIRMALGAEKRDVLRMVVGQGLRLALIGVAIGVAGALALTRFLSSLLYGVKPTDPLTFIAVSLLLIAVALAACYIPARRAAKVDPMLALRYE